MSTDVEKALEARCGSTLQKTTRYLMVHNGVQHVVYATREFGLEAWKLTDQGRALLESDEPPRRGRRPKHVEDQAEPTGTPDPQ